MDHSDDQWRIVWLKRLKSWQFRLDDTGLSGVASAFSDAFRPLGPVAAQLLWISQPGFALFGQYDSIDGLANLLNDWPDYPEQGESEHDR
jgi:hypothetical protein